MLKTQGKKQNFLRSQKYLIPIPTDNSIGGSVNNCNVKFFTLINVKKFIFAFQNIIGKMVCCGRVGNSWVGDAVKSSSGNHGETRPVIGNQ